MLNFNSIAKMHPILILFLIQKILKTVALNFNLPFDFILAKPQYIMCLPLFNYFFHLFILCYLFRYCPEPTELKAICTVSYQQH